LRGLFVFRDADGMRSRSCARGRDVLTARRP